MDNTAKTNSRNDPIYYVVHNELNANFVKWWHASLGSPTINTMLDAIKLGALRNIERLTTKIVRQNPPHTMATAMGHLEDRTIR